MNDYYADLGVSRDASPEEIKRAYRKLARTLHPDVNGSPEAEEQFKKVAQAYDVLSDADKKRSYDMGSDPYGGAQGGFGAGFSFTDIMDAFFGGTGGPSRGPRSRVRRGDDALIRAEIDLRTAVFGGEHELVLDTAELCQTCRGSGSQPNSSRRTCDVCRGAGEVVAVQNTFLGQVRSARVCGTCQGFGDIITDPCFDCSGDGRVRTRRHLTMRVPAGVDSGTRIQLAGEGEVGRGGGPAGDLYVEVEVAPHPIFTRRGNDLHCQLDVPMTAAALGTTIEIETFDGPREVEVAAGTQSGATMTMRDLGVTRLRGTGRGALQVHIQVVTPTKLDDEQRDLLRQLATLRGEEAPDGRLSEPSHAGGFFGKLREAFTGR